MLDGRTAVSGMIRGTNRGQGPSLGFAPAATPRPCEAGGLLRRGFKSAGVARPWTGGEAPDAP